MPSNADFRLSILVGDTLLPEYENDGIVFVESSFFTPHSYKQQAKETVNGETEVQSWPVTPFSVCIETEPSSQACYYRVYVDGQKVTSKSVTPGTKRVIKGFRDGTLVREFLFSLPRFAKNEFDRIDGNISSKVGIIEVESCYATLKTTQKRIRNKKLEYDQANKKDCGRVTGGSYLMSTTKAGRVVGMKNSFRNVDFWNVHSVTSRLSVKYVTAQTLQDMNVSIVPIPFPQGLYDTRSRALHSRPNILRKRSGNNTNSNASTEIKTEKDENVIESVNHVIGSSDHMVGSSEQVEHVVDSVNHVTGSSDHMVGSSDHQYTGGPNFIKEEVFCPILINGETIDLTFDDDESAIEIID
ncbi:uncharacterized protein LOC143068672 [Mytilus galloprovincialis]|uniref:uncharacterized protein LOC143068672 n=1 Tax=Mytilus galloprovincialis TaxID=29158 RepID=UPI003F7B8395